MYICTVSCKMCKKPCRIIKYFHLKFEIVRRAIRDRSRYISEGFLRWKRSVHGIVSAVHSSMKNETFGSQAARPWRVFRNVLLVVGTCLPTFPYIETQWTVTADYWKSQGRKFCDFCKCWIADNKPSIDFHEGGKKHKENVSKRLKEIHKNSAKQAKQNKKIENDIKKMENAAMAAYLKDVENNTRDMTADRIIKEKMNKTDTKDPAKSDRGSTVKRETMANFKMDNQQFPQEIDPCDPVLSRSTTTPHHTRYHQKSENKSQGKNKGNKGKGKGKKILEEDRPAKPICKLWYEARSPEGYTYYWNIESNEAVWEPPDEGYMTFAEQEEEAKEQAIQEELLKQLEVEEAVANADSLEEKRANAERERLKELRKARIVRGCPGTTQDDENVTTEEETRPFRRDYSIPEKSHPYGPWQTVRKIERKPVDLQLPQQKQLQLPVFEKTEQPVSQRTFKEKTITQIDTGDSDEDKRLTTFKKRKIGNKSVRQRLTDD